MTTISSTPDPAVARVDFMGQTALVPSDLCLADHAEGKTVWQRLAEVLDTDLENGGRVLWAGSGPRDKAYETPWWELTGYLTLAQWGLGFTAERNYDVGEIAWCAALTVGPWSLWLTRHRAVVS